MTSKRGMFGLWADRRGAVAFEVPFVYGFVFLALLLPLADLAVAGFQFIFGYDGPAQRRAVHAVVGKSL